MLGMPYDYSIDMWSIGCTLYEMYTGKILFTGDSNNQMLKSIMEIRGKMPPKTYKKGELADSHFDDKGNFHSRERDNVLGKVCAVLISFAPVVLVSILCPAFLLGHILAGPLPLGHTHSHVLAGPETFGAANIGFYFCSRAPVGDRDQVFPGSGL